MRGNQANVENRIASYYFAAVWAKKRKVGQRHATNRTYVVNLVLRKMTMNCPLQLGVLVKLACGGRRRRGCSALVVTATFLSERCPRHHNRFGQEVVEVMLDVQRATFGHGEGRIVERCDRSSGVVLQAYDFLPRDIFLVFSEKRLFSVEIVSTLVVQNKTLFVNLPM